MREIDGSTDAGGLRVALVVSRYNDFVTDRLLAGALQALEQAGAAEDDLAVVRVPGAFEVPAAAMKVARTGRFDAVVCLGCLIRGETPHFDHIASAASHAIARASGVTGVPITFGILTTNSAEEALARAGRGTANKGWEAALAAVQMATLFRRLADWG